MYWNKWMCQQKLIICHEGYRQVRDDMDTDIKTLVIGISPSVDYATDELISKTIRHEFAQSTILTIAHRLRTVIDYDRVMLLDQGRIIEFDRPATLIADPSSSFYALCKATGRNEFSMLKKMAGV